VCVCLAVSICMRMHLIQDNDRVNSQNIDFNHTYLLKIINSP
jgi:hypothetical protein